MRGCVANPDMPLYKVRAKNKYVGMKIKMKCGEEATCIEYYDKQNIVIRFEDGTIRKNVCVHSFVRGLVAKIPNTFYRQIDAKNKYLGTTLLMKCGEEATCIEYVSSDNVTLKFADGTIKKHVKVGNFIYGKVSKLKRSQTKSCKYLGKKIKMNCGEDATCIEYLASDNITLKFADGTIRKHVSANSFLNGTVAKKPRRNAKEAKEKHYIKKDVASQLLEA